ncbi:NAD-dependent epimerase [Muriicola sp. Z0-33]|uniref:NAD-dependent epimerase n=1 Tax=Muriicola sp. Z0-33 TaxID=2816957 RepID=UPI0022374D05|nr:NAD-dependent epimerase [Muriicola sp. Z0-33]MCW5515578.1 NAD-dependent epimerase [Muriicola sp. Z0-33]
MKILVTGAAGFIGFHLARRLIELGHNVIGLDNINDYYDVELKYARLEQLGISRKSAENFLLPAQSSTAPNNFSFVRMHLEDRESLPLLFNKEKFDVVCNLAAQAGVRYSLENPTAYIDSNIVGFLNLLECCRNTGVAHLVYASSSSVYGSNKEVPFSIQDNVDRPISLYAATKKSNELMAHTYSHLYGFATTGLRFFTVYGPWGRPDMALFLFTDAIVKNQPIKVFNYGKMERDFTYVDDIITGVVKVTEEDISGRKAENNSYKLYNIGNNKSVNLLDFIREIEHSLKKEAIKEMMPIQPGDVEKTWANVDDLVTDYGYQPTTQIKDGVKAFVSWYRDFYNI